MHTIKVRVYDTDSEGRRFLLHRPGDVVTAAEARRVAGLVAPAVEPIEPLDRMTVKELRAVCDAEHVDPAGATLRGDYIKVIGAARGQRPTSER